MPLSESDQPKLYTSLAPWYLYLTRSEQEDYNKEAAHFRRLFEKWCVPAPKRIPELGCGGGNIAMHLKATYDLTLTDIAPAMLAVSKEQNPTCRHIEGDMRSFRMK